MKLKKLTFAALATVASVITLASCNQNSVSYGSMEKHYSGSLKAGYTSLANTNENGKLDVANSTYTVAGKTIKTSPVLKTVYQTETSNDQFNYLTNQWQQNSDQYCNMVDGLVANDKYANVVGALALGYKTEIAGSKQIWTFQLKEGVKWVDNKTGEEKGEVKADDFVAAIEYVLNPINNSKTAGIVSGVIDGAEDYIKSLSNTDKTDDKSFDTVGVKAIDDYTIQYTLFEPTPYFLTCLTYSPFLPVSRAYLESQGTEFGKSENDILVNGAFRMTKHTKESKIVLTKNDMYWDAEHVYVGQVIQKFVPSTATSADIRKWFESGDIDSFSPNAKDERGYKKYVLGEDGKGSVKAPASDNCCAVQSVADRTFNGFFNFNRQAYEYKDSSKAKTNAQKNATKIALQNVNFRKGFLYGLNVLEYLKIYNPKAPIEFLGRSFTIRDLCTADGKDYVDYLNDVYNREQGTTGVDLTGINNGSDPIFDKAKAAEFFQAAKEELISSGKLTASDFPIKVDVVRTETVEDQPYEDATYAPLKEAAAGVMDLVLQIAGDDTTYDKWVTEDANYDFNMLTGWGPDYADPKTFLHCYVEDGDNVMYLGFGDTSDPEVAALQTSILGAYTEKFNEGAAITDATKLAERYQKFAEAEYKLIYEDAIIIPWLTNTGWRASVTKILPYHAKRASYGLSSTKFSDVIVSTEVVTKELREAIKADYDSKK